MVLGPLGPKFEAAPGSIIDTRYNAYVLEHFTRWMRGLDKEYWTAGFFYPYSWTTAFSVNLLGSAPLYSWLRWIGFTQLAALQAWYVGSFVCNFAASAYVLLKLRLRPLATAVGAFFFTFGLPALAQEIHVQMAYRFCVPLACFFLWTFFLRPRGRTLVGLGVAIVWQFYLEIYSGILLIMLLVAFVLIMPFFDWPRPRGFSGTWIPRLRQAWTGIGTRERLVHLILISILTILLGGLLLPYFTVSRMYGFARTPADIAVFVPRVRGLRVPHLARSDRAVLGGNGAGHGGPTCTVPSTCPLSPIP